MGGSVVAESDVENGEKRKTPPKDYSDIASGHCTAGGGDYYGTDRGYRELIDNGRVTQHTHTRAHAIGHRADTTATSSS